MSAAALVDIPSYELRQFFSERHRPFRMDGAHWHSQVEVNFLRQGEVTYLVSGAPVRLAAGRFAIFWGASPHQILSQTADSEIIVIYVPLPVFLSLRLPERFRRRIMGGGFLVDREADPADAILLPRWHEELEARHDALTDLVRQEVACRIRRLAVGEHVALRSIDVAARPHTVVDQDSLAKVRQMTVMIASRFAEPLSVQAVAEAAGLHPNYAMALFRRAIGMTISEFTIRQRLSHAQAILADTDRSIASIARASGFGSQSRFYEVFSERVGKTPTRYRAELAKATLAPAAPPRSAPPVE